MQMLFFVFVYVILLKNSRGVEVGAGKILERKIKEQGITVAELSRRTGIKPQTLYAAIKRDNTNISYQTAQKLAEALECSESDFFELGEDKKYYDSLKLKVSNLTNELKTLKNNNELVEYKFFDTDGNYLYTEKRNSNEDEIVPIEYELSLLSEEIDELLKNNNISIKPVRYAEIINYYVELNDLGKEEAVKRVEELTYIEKYKKK